MRKYDKVMMQTAIAFAEMSYCKRSKVGAVLSNKGRIVAVGYNGTIKGTDNSCEDICQACDGLGITDKGKCKHCDGKGSTTSEFVLHAEQNLLTFCNREGLNTNECSLYVTMAPCKTCSKLIASAGIKEVFYKEKYRDPSGIEFLGALGVKVTKLGVNDEV